MRVRRKPGLQPVWMQHQQRVALDSRCEDRRTFEGRTYGEEFSRCRFGCAEDSRRTGFDESLGGRALCRRQSFARADSGRRRRRVVARTEPGLRKSGAWSVFAMPTIPGFISLHLWFFALPGRPAGFSWVRSRNPPRKPAARPTEDSPNLSRSLSAAARASFQRC
jgi:hypothetical protein